MKHIIWILLIITVSRHVEASELTVGRTWDIVEPDPIKEAKSRASSIPKEKLKPKNSFRERLAAKNIFRTITPKIRQFTPTHTLENQVVDKEGRVLYPVGYTFNPIKYMKRFQQRVVVIDQEDAQLIEDDLKPTDIVIVNNGNLKEVSELLRRKITMLDIFSAESMDIRRVPTVVSIDYENHYYQINEFLSEQGLPQ